MPAVAVAAPVALLAAACGEPPLETAPPRLADTGLFADPAARTIADGLVPFAPQFPLWTDGAEKRRWISLPDGTAVDASDPDDFQFPIGTRLWKEFTFPGGVETRFMQRRRDGSWLYASYTRSHDGEHDLLAPDSGVRGFCASEGGRHDVPSIADCRGCHENGRTPVLGFSALQLADRLSDFAAQGIVQELPARLLAAPPRIAARSDVERRALGYLHGNCSSCHNAVSPLQRLGLRLDHPAALAAGEVPPALATTAFVASSFARGDATLRIAPGAPRESVLLLRVAAADPVTQMPPFGRHLVDREAVAVLERWIAELPTGAAPPGARAVDSDH